MIIRNGQYTFFDSIIWESNGYLRLYWKEHNNKLVCDIEPVLYWGS